jgi:hypothetical protein
MVKRKFRGGPDEIPGTKCLKTKEKSNSNSSNAFNPLNNLPEMTNALPQDTMCANNSHPTRKTRAAKSRKPQPPDLPATPPADWNNFKSDETLDPNFFNLKTNPGFSNASPSIFSRAGASSDGNSGCQTPTQRGTFTGSPPDLLGCTFGDSLAPALPINSKLVLEVQKKLLSIDVSFLLTD